MIWHAILQLRWAEYRLNSPKLEKLYFNREGAKNSGEKPWR